MDTEDFDFYFTKIGGKVASVFVNLGLGESAPVDHYGQVVVVQVTMCTPREDGLSSDKEFDALVALETALEDALVDLDNAIYVGRTTHGGRRDFYYYAVDAAAAAAAARRALAAMPEYKFEVLAQPDRGWEIFLRFLLPSPRDRERMANRSVCEQLQRSGDPLVEAREIDHWAYFKSPGSRDAFVARATAMGYKLRVAHGPNPKASSATYSAQIYRIDIPGDEITTELRTLAAECGGEYDGWESPVLPFKKPN